MLHGLVDRSAGFEQLEPFLDEFRADLHGACHGLYGLGHQEMRCDILGRLASTHLSVVNGLIVFLQPMVCVAQLDVTDF